MLLCAGCAWNQNESITNGSDEPSSSTDMIEDVSVLAGKQAPYWAQGTQTEGTWFQNLNLDGIGDSDDEAYVSVYQFDDYEEKVTVLQIHLGTGELMAKVFHVYGDYSFMTGNLFSENKDAILLEVRVPASNYGAAHLFVLDIFPVGIDPIPETAVRLDTTSSQNVLFMGDSFLDAGNVYTVGGTEIVDLEKLPLKGLKIVTIDPTGRYEQLEKILYWNDGEWSVLTE